MNWTKTLIIFVSFFRFFKKSFEFLGLRNHFSSESKFHIKATKGTTRITQIPQFYQFLYHSCKIVISNLLWTFVFLQYIDLFIVWKDTMNRNSNLRGRNGAILSNLNYYPMLKNYKNNKLVGYATPPYLQK